MALWLLWGMMAGSLSMSMMTEVFSRVGNAPLKRVLFPNKHAFQWMEQVRAKGGKMNVFFWMFSAGAWGGM
jgi:hypothetical protein